MKVIDEFLPKIEELVHKTQGKVRADKVHDVLAHGPAVDPAGGRGGEDGVAGGEPSGASAVGE